MGFLDKTLLDKVKESAQQAMQQAQVGMTQGQAKLNEIQLKRQSDALLRDLGAAYYAEQRNAGPAAAVRSAMAALDGHAAGNGPIDTAAPQSPTAPTAAAPPPTAAPPPPAPGGTDSDNPPGGGGSFSLDDL